MGYWCGTYLLCMPLLLCWELERLKKWIWAYFLWLSVELSIDYFASSCSSANFIAWWCLSWSSASFLSGVLGILGLLFIALGMPRSWAGFAYPILLKLNGLSAPPKPVTGLSPLSIFEIAEWLSLCYCLSSILLVIVIVWVIASSVGKMNWEVSNSSPMGIPSILMVSLYSPSSSPSCISSPSLASSPYSSSSS